TVSIIVNSLPVSYNVTGGGDYCLNGSGVVVGLNNSENNVLYQLKLNNANSGSQVMGNGNPLSFGNQTLAGDYTVTATHSITGCTAGMNGIATVNILPNPQIA